MLGLPPKKRLFQVISLTLTSDGKCYRSMKWTSGSTEGCSFVHFFPGAASNAN